MTAPDENVVKRVPSRRLLLVDDEEAILRALKRVFGSQYDVYEATDGRAGLEMARRVKPHVVISDQSMPNMTGVELFAHLRDEMPDTVRILVTGYTDYNSLVDAVNAAHVHHYFEKPFHTLDLKSVVDTLLRNHSLESERELLLQQLHVSVKQLENANNSLANREESLEQLLRRRTHDLSEANRKLQESNAQLSAMNAQLQELAVRDPLTGVFNHRYLTEHAQIELARCQRYKREFVIIFLDVDSFKSINDTLGHGVGDQVLCAIAKLIRPSQEGLRRSDFAARYGGEEFCVLLPETPLEGGRTKGERLRQAIEAFPWTDIDPRLPAVTTSVGVAAYPNHGDTLQSLLDAADAAMYEAKRGGKNRVVVAGDKQ